MAKADVNCPRGSGGITFGKKMPMPSKTVKNVNKSGVLNKKNK